MRKKSVEIKTHSTGTNLTNFGYFSSKNAVTIENLVSSFANSPFPNQYCFFSDLVISRSSTIEEVIRSIFGFTEVNKISIFRIITEVIV